MNQKSIDLIKAVVYDSKNKDNEITAGLLSIQKYDIIHYSEKQHLDPIIDELRLAGYGSKEVLILKNFKGRVFQRCPCSKNMVNCGYLLFNISFGCLYNCTYCYLNSYINSYGIIQFTNLNFILKEIKKNFKDKTGRIYRIGSGEYTDSLMIDDLTGICRSVIIESKNFKNIIFEFKTKSDNVDHLLDIRDKGNIVLAWSLNTEKNIELYEEGTAGLNERIESALKAEKAGYFLAFHLDPIIIYENCIDDYIELIDRLFSRIDINRVMWISLGCFRYSPGFKDIIMDRFPDEKLTTEEMFPSIDGKFKYLKKKRIDIYKRLIDKIYSFSKKPFIYLCMESRDVWESVFYVNVNTAEDISYRFGEHLKKHFID